MLNLLYIVTECFTCKNKESLEQERLAHVVQIKDFLHISLRFLCLNAFFNGGYGAGPRQVCKTCVTIVKGCCGFDSHYSPPVRGAPVRKPGFIYFEICYEI